MDNPTYVDKSEELYRRILSNKFNTKTPSQYVVDSAKIIIKSEAFLGGEKPSVNRAKLTGFKPKCTRENSTDGVISIKAADIKRIKVRHHAADVEITPSDDNDAHAEIVLIPKPNNMTRSLLRNLRDALARKAVCIIPPNPL